MVPGPQQFGSRCGDFFLDQAGPGHLQCASEQSFQGAPLRDPLRVLCIKGAFIGVLHERLLLRGSFWRREHPVHPLSCNDINPEPNSVDGPSPLQSANSLPSLDTAVNLKPS